MLPSFVQNSCIMELLFAVMWVLSNDFDCFWIYRTVNDSFAKAIDSVFAVFKVVPLYFKCGCFFMRSLV